MKKLKAYNLPFAGLKIGRHDFAYKIDSSFFDSFDCNDYSSVDVSVDVVLQKKETVLELQFSHVGVVNVPCDATGEDYDQPISGKLNLIIKFGESFNNDSEELIVLPYSAFEVNIAHYIFESIVLSVPLKRLHPSVEDDYLFDEEDENNLVFVATTNTEVKEDTKVEEKIDPRWSKLKNLLTDNN